ncbi:hypothetical protein BG006_001968 [Podila minutissima]|uniref:FAD-binding domain-containing protein n=1 Tax=Podila minutissima TaxID=64525 RepID=A0A9P5SPK6_9FUNG|nr:hypothetical protein BG006_001968 [Podila minutissima]
MATVDTDNISSEGVPPKVAMFKPRLTPEEREEMKKPEVLIVGAGIGGVTLALLLHKAKIPFTLFDRAKQLGIFEEFKAIGKPSDLIQMYNDDLQPEFVMDFSERTALTGGQEYIVARPDVYDLLLRQIPKEKILLGKKVLSSIQSENGVLIRCSDGTTYEGDILVGADGAYSAVRQQLYKDLKKEGKLPRSDDMALPFSSVCLVGQTEVLDPEEFPDLKHEYSQFMAIQGRQEMYSSSKDNDSFRNSEWGPEAAETMCKQVRHFKVPGGKDRVLTIGDLIDRTPKDLISKVMLEEKVFDTWYALRTVLLGDACHKLHPSGGAGALTAMHDAVALANWISSLKGTSLAHLKPIFKEYYAERFPIAKETFATSHMLSKIPGKGFVSRVTKEIFRRMPAWMFRLVVLRVAAARPQVSFLPLVEDKGTAKVQLQPSLSKTLALQEQRKKAVPV